MAKSKRKRRVRLDESPKKSAVKAMREGRKKSLKNAPRRENGKTIQGYAYKAVLEGYRENGLEPTVIGPDPSRPPMFVVQPGLARRIVRFIRMGYPYTTVCRYVGVTPKTFRDWLDKGKAGYSREYVRFYEQVAKAEAKAEMKTLDTLKMHEKSDWRVSAWQLERRWPEHWAKKDRVIAEHHVDGQIAVDVKDDLRNNVLRDEAARDLARTLIEGSEFGYKRITDESVEDA